MKYMTGFGFVFAVFCLSIGTGTRWLQATVGALQLLLFISTVVREKRSAA